VFVTPSSGRPMRNLLKKSIRFLLCCYTGCAIKCKIYSCFEIYNAVTTFKPIFLSSFCILKILKMLVKTLHCSTLISVGSCFLLCVLAKRVFTVSSCVWVRNAVEILRRPRSCRYVVPLPWCGKLQNKLQMMRLLKKGGRKITLMSD